MVGSAQMQLLTFAGEHDDQLPASRKLPVVNKTLVSNSGGKRRSFAVGCGQKICKMFDLLTIEVTKKTVCPKREESSEAVPDVHKPLDDSIMTEIPDSVQELEEFKEEGNNDYIKILCCLPCFHIPGNFDKNEHVTRFLDSFMITRNHRIHKYLWKANVFFLKNMDWKVAAVAALKDSDYPGAPRSM